jgi:hypothetical protein
MASRWPIERRSATALRQKCLSTPYSPTNPWCSNSPIIRRRAANQGRVRSSSASKYPSASHHLLAAAKSGAGIVRLSESPSVKIARRNLFKLVLYFAVQQEPPKRGCNLEGQVFWDSKRIGNDRFSKALEKLPEARPFWLRFDVFRCPGVLLVYNKTEMSTFPSCVRSRTLAQ